MPKACLAPRAQPSDYRKLPGKTVATLRERAERIKAALKRSLVEVGSTTSRTTRRGYFSD
jgi:hypothetical protein